jgi:aminoglycoside phosphotransferase (APT) family kinase protein
MELAAIASAAVPGLAPTGVAGAPDDPADFESALVVDGAGKQWRVRSPKHPEASMRLETELQALRAFTPAVKAELPFLIPHIAGSVRQGELSTFVYSHLTGTARSLEALAAGGRAMAEEIGRALAAVHDLPQDMVQRADLPSYEAEEYRQRKLNELDQAATTGRIPAILLRRWEHALEDVALWRFTPTVVHGDLHEDHLLIAAGRVSAVTGWTDLSIGDPAADFAWLAAAEDSSFVDAVYASYAKARGAAVDPHVARRAALAAEFALAQWLVRGVALDDARMVAEADGMLATLRADVETIEHEQREAAERARLAHEEQLEWGDAAGTDVPDAKDRPRLEDMDRVPVDGGEAARHPPHDRRDSRDRTEPLTGSTDTPIVSESSSTPSFDAPRNGSHVFDPDTSAVDERPTTADPAGPSDDNPRAPAESAPVRDVLRPTDEDVARSGSSAAYARLTAARRTSSTAESDRARAARPANMTLLRSGSTDTAEGSSDDVRTSTLPVISYGS